MLKLQDRIRAEIASECLALKSFRERLNNLPPIPSKEQIDLELSALENDANPSISAFFTVPLEQRMDVEIEAVLRMADLISEELLGSVVGKQCV